VLPHRIARWLPCGKGHSSPCLKAGAFWPRKVKVYVLVNGERQQVELDRLDFVDTARVVGPVWCPTANVVGERAFRLGGRIVRRAHAHFAPGTKVYCLPPKWGDGYEQIVVFGHHRGSHRYVKMVINWKWLTNWRVKLAYSPHVIRLLWPDWTGTERSKAEAQEIVDWTSSRAAAPGEGPQ